MAQGVIIEPDVLDAGTSRGPRVNNRKRAGVGESHGPSKRRPGPLVKEEEKSANYREQRIRVLQVSRVKRFGLVSASLDTRPDGCACRLNWIP